MRACETADRHIAEAYGFLGARRKFAVFRLNLKKA
jgi:hypothetical protein